MNVRDRVDLLTRIGIEVLYMPRLRNYNHRVIYRFDDEEGFIETVGMPSGRRVSEDHPLYRALVAEVGAEKARELVGEPNDKGQFLVRIQRHTILDQNKKYIFSFQLPATSYII